MTLRTSLRDGLRARGYVWFRKPELPWGLDLQTDLQRWFDLDAFTCVVDVGAHVGKFSLQFAQMCPRAQVIAFEMMPPTFETLKTNVQGVARIQPHCVGLSDETGSVMLRVEQDSQLNSLRNRTTAPDGAATVPIALRRLDDMAAELGIATIDLLKVDAEGFDLQVLKGALRLFEARQVRAVLAEVDFGNSNIAHGNFTDIAAWLAPWGLMPLAFYEPMVVEHNGVAHLDYINALFVRRA